MATVLCLKSGNRFDFNDNCYCYLDDKGAVQFIPQRTVSGCLRLFTHKGQWIVDARKCKHPVAAAGKTLNDKPRLLRDRAIIKIGEQRLLFAVSLNELSQAYDELRKASQRRSSVNTKDPFNDLLDTATNMKDAVTTIDDGDHPTGELSFEDGGMVPPEKMTESPSEWTLSGIADAVISHQTGKLHERQMKKPAGDETPDVSGATGIGDVDRIAGKKRNTGFIAAQFKLTPKGEVVKGKEAMHLDDHDLGESTNELQLEDTGNATMELIGGFDDIDLDDDKPAPPRKPMPPKDQGKGGKKK